jgi:hypothetical protein
MEIKKNRKIADGAAPINKLLRVEKEAKQIYKI